MAQVIEAVYENGVIKPLSAVKENVLLVLISRKVKKKQEEIMKYAGVLKNVSEKDIEKILEEIESGEGFY